MRKGGNKMIGKTMRQGEMILQSRLSRGKPIPMSKVLELTGYTRGYIYQLVHYNKIPCHKPTGKRGRIHFFETEILDFLYRGKQATDYEVSEKADAILNERRKI
jgi:excisionase family DNA binding protein